jgi:hypothetical protein
MLADDARAAARKAPHCAACGAQSACPCRRSLGRSRACPAAAQRQAAAPTPQNKTLGFHSQRARVPYAALPRWRRQLQAVWQAKQGCGRRAATAARRPREQRRSAAVCPRHRRLASSHARRSRVIRPAASTGCALTPAPRASRGTPPGTAAARQPEAGKKWRAREQGEAAAARSLRAPLRPQRARCAVAAWRARARSTRAQAQGKCAALLPGNCCGGLSAQCGGCER